MAIESKTAEQKLQKMEDSRRKNEKMAKQFEKVPTVVMYREVLKESFWFLFEELWILDSCSVRETSCSLTTLTDNE